VIVTYGRGYTLAPLYLIILSTFYVLAGLAYPVLGPFLNGVGETKTVLKMCALQLAVYLPVGLGLAWLWGPYGLLIA
jgi:hypothetical protein